MAEITFGKLKQTKTDVSADKEKNNLVIIDVNRENHVVQLNVAGCPITLTCTAGSNSAIYGSIKTVLLNTVAGTIPSGS